SAENRNGCGWQAVKSIPSHSFRGLQWRIIGVRKPLLPGSVPLILRFAKVEHRNLTSKPLLDACIAIVEHGANRVRVVIILIDDHQGPLLVRAQDSVCSHQDMSF